MAQTPQIDPVSQFLRYLDDRISKKEAEKQNTQIGRIYDLLETEIAEAWVIRLEFKKRFELQ